MLTANADSHLQKYEKKKIGRENKTDKITGTTSTTGDTVIGDLLDRNMILIPIAIDPFGRSGPILQTFLYDTQPTNPITFTPTKPNATSMYHKSHTFQAQKASSNSPTIFGNFYGHSYSAPTPTINTLQQIGLTITKAFAIHIRYGRRRFLNHSAITLTPDPTVPNGQSIEEPKPK
jgi:hypothetical protein